MKSVDTDYSNLQEEIDRTKQLYPYLKVKGTKDGYKITLITNTVGKLTWKYKDREELLTLLSGLYWGFHINISKA